MEFRARSVWAHDYLTLLCNCGRVMKAEYATENTTIYTCEWIHCKNLVTVYQKDAAVNSVQGPLSVVA